MSDISDIARPDPAPPPFLLRPPVGAPKCVVFAVPHSGRYYPPALVKNAALTPHNLRLCEDAYVDHLFSEAPGFGAALLVATHARSYLDLNRAENELDPMMFSPTLDTGALYISHRVKAGLGTIPKQVAEGLNIYDAPLPQREAWQRIDTIHKPYHTRLRSLVDARRRQFGHAILIDCHSMPSEGGSGRGRTSLPGPDIVLGDCWGTACGRELASMAEEMLVRAGFSVRRNVPYAGGFVTQHYGSPGNNVHALQIELNRALYMDEETIEPHDGFGDVQERLTRFMADFTRNAAQAFPDRTPGALPRAAE
ncbi:N-formylglutamate amidohydrolase [Kordiimonas marina]|uniref:N-formylglutamate amidohydrolase n=1 Tax=Kordiimonas marina TaxID=2872312 RepID=UPI001FF12EA0|nr:N-formylglutamate amidohydrolase [Kordiimonas marina]MCJ9428610.1 N-formylglutamate amidohydrolase [Kordiimonas marina]